MDALVEREVISGPVLLDHKETPSFVVNWVEPDGEVLHVLELLIVIMVLEKLCELLLSLLGHVGPVLGLHHDALENGLETLHIWEFSSKEDDWACVLLVHLSLGLAEFLGELLLDNLADVSAVVLHEEVSVPVGSEIELDFGVFDLESAFEELVDYLLFGREFV